MLFECEVNVVISDINKKCTARFSLNNFRYIKNWHNTSIYRSGRYVIVLIDGFRFVSCEFESEEDAEEAFAYLRRLDVIDLWRNMYDWITSLLDKLEADVANLASVIDLFADSLETLKKLVDSYLKDRAN